MKKVFNLIINIIIPLGLGTLVGFLSGSNIGYSEFIKPIFAPPGIVFPIVWSILYTLMGISTYLVKNSFSSYNKIAIKIYYYQLVINLLWSFIFFKFNLLFLAALWIVLLIFVVVKMIIAFKKVNKLAAYLQIPYLLWLIFALILNISISILN